MEPADLEFLRAGYDALNRRDEDALRRLLHPDIVIKTSVETFRGHEGVVEFVRRVDEIFDDFSISLEEVSDAGDCLIALTHQVGRGKYSEARVDHHVTHVWRVHDGRGVWMEAFVDHSEALVAAAAGFGPRSPTSDCRSAGR